MFTEIEEIQDGDQTPYVEQNIFGLTPEELNTPIEELDLLDFNISETAD